MELEWLDHPSFRIAIGGTTFVTDPAYSHDPDAPVDPEAFVDALDGRYLLECATLIAPVSGSERTDSVSRLRERFGLHDVHPWVFLAHVVVAVAAFSLGTVGLLEGAGLGAIPHFGIGVLLLLLGRSAGRIAARR